MKRFIDFLMIVLFGLAGVVFACMPDCPTPDDVERGIYTIAEDSSSINAPSSGTVEIRDTEVEIVYPDADNNEWHVVYKITKEE